MAAIKARVAVAGSQLSIGALQFSTGADEKLTVNLSIGRSEEEGHGSYAFRFASAFPGERFNTSVARELLVAALASCDAVDQEYARQDEAVAASKKAKKAAAAKEAAAAKMVEAPAVEAPENNGAGSITLEPVTA